MVNKQTIVAARLPGTAAFVRVNELLVRWTSYSPSFWLWITSPVVVLLMFVANYS